MWRKITDIPLDSLTDRVVMGRTIALLNDFSVLFSLKHVMVPLQHNQLINKIMFGYYFTPK